MRRERKKKKKEEEEEEEKNIDVLRDNNRRKEILVSKAYYLHECEPRDASNLLILVALMPKQDNTGENRS